MLAPLLVLALQQSQIAEVAQPISELSGLVQSRTYKGVYWAHNDSGDSARIFPIRLDGTVVPPSKDGIFIEGAENHDWEDIASDGKTLFISDMGNNGNARKNLGVYRVSEPNPNAGGKSKASRFVPIRYPDQTKFPPDAWEFDCEAVFFFRKKLWFLTKHRLGQRFPNDTTKLYRLDTMRPDRENVLTLIERKSDLGGWVTAADASPDGRRLAVLCHFPTPCVWVFEPGQSDRLLSGKSRRIELKNVGQAEAIAFEDAGHVIVGSEDRRLFRVSLD